MTENQRYTKLVDGGTFDLPTTVPLGEEDSFIDERGAIVNILLTPITSVGRIASKRGSVRANHYHLTDWHYALVESGKVLYFERAIGETHVPEPKEYGVGKMFFTPPNREHAMLFAEDSVIFTFAKNVRSHDSHEADLKRVTFVTPAVVAYHVPPLASPSSTR